MAEPSYIPLQAVYNVAISTAQSLTGLLLTQANIDKSDAVMISATTATIFFTLDGATPTATNGNPLDPINGPAMLLGRELLSGLKFYSATGTVNATLLARV